MNKPFTIQVQETEQKIVEVINNSQLPAYVIKTLLQNIFNEVQRVEQEEINKYNEEQKKVEEKADDNG